MVAHLSYPRLPFELVGLILESNGLSACASSVRGPQRILPKMGYRGQGVCDLLDDAVRRLAASRSSAMVADAIRGLNLVPQLTAMSPEVARG
jgi:hypothetical protein